MEVSKSDLEDLQKAIVGVTNGGDYNLQIMNEIIAGKNNNHDIISKKLKQSKKTKKGKSNDQIYMMNSKDLKKLNRKRKKNKLNI